MGIILNEEEKFREYYGDNTSQMSKLVADARIPLSFAGIMDRRLEVRGSLTKGLKEGWHDNCFDSGDGALYLPNGNLVVVYDAKNLREMTKSSKLFGGALDLTGLDLKEITGERFTKKQLERMVLDQYLTFEQAVTHPLWLALARGDKKRLKNYAEMVFEETKERFGYVNNMAVCLDSASKNPKMRTWSAYWMYDRSLAISSINFYFGKGRLVGVASERKK